MCDCASESSADMYTTCTCTQHVHNMYRHTCIHVDLVFIMFVYTYKYMQQL